ncbi:uncharacterized protein N7496_006278 [Penicillium cataractarum]|uniref:Transcriptional regulatory protein RXT2 N-terminal domain-containing protein n=1 Tax=Penicillium cataractarum TaxID=2100454 RepID=A0A9W9S192_9EURO|nr:uncharacterized protein N7496_006278 [Penicillium cataractarum]KAJ5370186.1 hypothetical protein N7496_006278 [Penicillium cataractarum]
MATQAALIADTIVGMKRALRREREDSGPDDAITQPTNRGNKMRANAKYVREGALGYINAEEFYKEKIDHAGYTRHILQRNPIRYDSEGEELDEEDEDSEADAAAAEENPFSGIALETLLCPLKHPSELPVHPSLSHPYTTQALEQMTQTVEEKLRQEKALLWRARNLHRKFLGDGSWMPCGLVETLDDRYIFEPRIVDDIRNLSAGQQRQSALGTPSAIGDLSGPQDLLSTTGQLNDRQTATAGDVEMTEVPAASNDDLQEAVTEFKSEETDAMVKDLPQHPAEDPDQGSETIDRNGIANTNGEAAHHETNEDDNEQDTEMHEGSSPEPPRRMTTRAQANATNPSDGNQSPLSADNASFLQTPHPLFVIPENVRPDANFGLPPSEAEETRRLLWSYIQKQEETVRGFEHMLESLLRATHMKADVLEWCKAEGHVGEMSDGEDWYDREKWGLAEGEDLKKGTDEDEVETVDESRTTAKRGRGRRQ